MDFFAQPATSRQLLGLPMALPVALSLVALAGAGQSVRGMQVVGQVQPAVPPQEGVRQEQSIDGDLLARVEVKRPNIQSLKDLVKRLGNDDWATREAASRELTSTMISLSMIEEMLQGSELSSEQRQRLQAAGYASFASSDRGALGVSFDARQAEGGIGIGRCEPGFHSHEVLRAGDIIRQIDGKPVQDLYDVRPNVITKDPGETVELDVLRDGEMQQITLRLGSFRMLSGSAPLDGATLQQAWSNRLARRSPAANGRSGKGVTGTVRVPSLTATGDDTLPVMVSFRERDQGDNADAVEIELGAVALAGGKHARVTPSAMEFFRQSPDNAEQFAAVVKQLENQQRLWETQARRLETRLQEPNLGDARRARIKSELGQVQVSLDEVRRQLAQIEQARAVEEDER
jgi:hypothetical protein